METPDRLRPQDLVRITIINTVDAAVHTYTGDGFNDVISAINKAWDDWATRTGNIEDYSFNVDDLATGITHGYRINAHGNLKLIV